MFRNTHRAPLRTLAAFLVVGVSHASESQAEVPAIDITPVEVREISDLGAAIVIPTHPAVDTYIEFPRDIRDTNTPLSRPFFEAAHRYDLLRIRLDENAAVGSKGSIYIDTASGRHTLLLEVVDKPEDATSGLILTLGSDSKQMHAEIASHMEDFKTRYIALEKKRSAQMARYGARIAAARVMANDGYLVPVAQRALEGSATDIHIRMDGGLWIESDFITSFDITNDRMQPFRAADIWAVDADGRKIRAELVSIGSSGPSAAGTIAEVAPGRSARIVVAIPNAAEGRFTSMQLHIGSPHAMGMAMVNVERWTPADHYRAMTADFLEEKRREEAAKGRVSIHVEAIGGAIWLGDGLEQNKLDPTTLTGLGVRAIYGFNRWVAFEGAIMGAGTGQARFSGMTYNEQEGELVRSASLGRVQLGGVLRFGHRIVPTVRLGVGLQGAGYDSELMTTGGAMAVTDSAIEVDAFFTFGAGLDVRLGESFVAGAAASYHSPATGNVRSLGAGVHLGYAWKP